MGVNPDIIILRADEQRGRRDPPQDQHVLQRQA